MILQGSPEWFQAKLGKVGASRISDVLAKGKGVTRGNYLAELVSERLTGRIYEDGYENAYMLRGKEMEDEARNAYEFITGNVVQLVGFVDHPTIPMSGASPDRLVNDDGLLEIKCRKTALHLEYLLTNTIKYDESVQMQWQLACTGRKWCDFVSYDPRMPPELQLFIKRVVRDDARIHSLEEEVRAFLAEVDVTVRKLQALRVV